ncbi:PREDICTED: pentatricopeptide repeat-containing protein At1g80550, mitochondrial isoform X1 [Lupinus angustifolius]|uniref:pentatricopeptide repeat-containing protein At1g80550, mitochondrial isoform X1 n=1 Tax=Lupinus angustifolius TaxID=3871 RepID=UPI00092EE8A9|nr:PREDICTED: pentatricopeptide repeat-containing protein At1g80550, mitochondrial isoform X1 [Lupinus angustifolius]
MRCLISHVNGVRPFHPLTSFFIHFQTLISSISKHTQCSNFHSSNSNSTLQTLTPLDHETVRETLVSFNNDWKRALEFFNWVEETQSNFHHSTDTFNYMLDILGKSFEFSLCWNLIHRMKQNPCSLPDHTTFRVMFKRYVSAHEVNEAIDTFQRLEEFNLKDNASFCNLIDSLCEYKHVIEAQDLIFGKNKILGFDQSLIFGNNKIMGVDQNSIFGSNKIMGVDQNSIFGENKNLGVDGVENNDTKICNMILRGWYKLGWWSKCRDFWDEMDRRGVHKSLYSYSIYMDIMCKSGKPWKAVKLYKEVKNKGIKLDVVVYNIVIKAIGLSQGVDSSIRVYREMKELGLKPTIVTYNTIIRLLCDGYRYKEALALLHKMRKNGCHPNVASYHCFFACLEKPKEILELFDRMVESGVRPTTDTCVMLMKKFGRWGFLRLVFLVWNRMEKLGCSPDASAYNALIDALVEKGLIDMARKYDEEMLAKGLAAKPRKELGTKLVEEDCADEYK